MFYNLPRPEEPRLLLYILNEGEITDLIRYTDNLNYNALFITAYRAGLWVGKWINLKIVDMEFTANKVPSKKWVNPNCWRGISPFFVVPALLMNTD